MITPNGRATVNLLEAVTGAVTGDVFPTNNCYYHAVQIVGTGSFSAVIEVSLDGTNWSTVSTVTTVGITQFTGIFTQLRARTTSATSAVTVIYKWK